MYALYARQSVDNKESISIENQLDLCRQKAIGHKCVEYKDKGFSGKNTERPAFQKMMEDIRKGEIEAIVVYKLDRISRSVLDFSKILEELQKYNVNFISVMEAFDTTQPMGRAMIQICAVFAQLERETIQQRVTDAYYSRCKKKFYMGGRVPYGYRLEPYTIDGLKTSRYVEVPEEAEQVKLIYALYAESKNSLGSIVTYLNTNGIRNRRGSMWNSSRISDILRNPIYARADADVYNFFCKKGAHINNPIEDFVGLYGCYLYKGTENPSSKRSDLTDKELVLAPHEGLISGDLWVKCRIRCMNNRQSALTCGGKNSWLTGKVKCGNCGYALTIAKANTKMKRYFVCSQKFATKGTGCHGTGGTIYATVLEEYVLDRIKERLHEFECLKAENVRKDNPKLNQLKIQLTGCETRIEELVSQIPQANEVTMKYINRTLEQLDNQMHRLNEEILKLSDTTADGDIAVITEHAEQWESLSFEDKKKVVDTLIQVIHIANGEIVIDWKF